MIFLTPYQASIRGSQYRDAVQVSTPAVAPPQPLISVRTVPWDALVHAVNQGLRSVCTHATCQSPVCSALQILSSCTLQKAERFIYSQHTLREEIY